MAGLSIAFEGLDGCGKSTQLQRAQEWLQRRHAGRELLCLREPGGTEFGERVRDLVLGPGHMSARSETLLYMASRAELYATRILPALERNALVLLDRSHYSTVAYQGAGLFLGTEPILRLAEWVMGGRPPDRVVFLRMAPDRARERLRAGGAAADRIESRDEAYFARVAQAYDELAAAEPERFVVVDADRDATSVAREIQERLAHVA